MVWNEQLKRQIPAGWEVKPLLEIVNWESNSQPPKSEFIFEPKDGYIRFIQNRDYESESHITYIPYKDSLSIWCLQLLRMLLKKSIPTDKNT